MKYLVSMACGMIISLRRLVCLLLTITVFAGCLVGCAPKDDRTVVTFSTWGSETEINILKPLLEEFEQENPMIRVDLVHIPQNYFQKLHMLVAANLTPDVMFVNNLNLPLYASGNVFKDLSPFLKSSDILHREDFYPQTLRAMTVNGTLVGIPRDISNVVVYYNKDLFDNYKVSFPSKGWTFGDYQGKAKLLTQDTDQDGKIDHFGASFDDLFLFYLPYVWSAGGNLVSDDKKTFLMAEPVACNALQFYTDLRNRFHVVPSFAEKGNNTSLQMFLQGKVAMYVSGRWVMPKIKEENPFSVGVVPFPAGDAGSVVGADGSGWTMSAKTKHPEAAWQLIEFLASPSSSSAFTRSGLIVPALKPVAESEAFLSDENDRVFLEVISTSYPTPALEQWHEVMDVLDEALEPVWMGDKKACPSLDKVKADVEKLL